MLVEAMDEENLLIGLIKGDNLLLDDEGVLVEDGENLLVEGVE